MSTTQIWEDDGLAEALAERDRRIAKALKLAYASNDGSEYEHDHGPEDGYPECPACWAAVLRAALTQDQQGDDQ